jgi:hypothetical protein
LRESVACWAVVFPAAAAANADFVALLLDEVGVADVEVLTISALPPVDEL